MTSRRGSKEGGHGEQEEMLIDDFGLSFRSTIHRW